MKIGIICSYPPEGEKHAFGEGGISWYSSNLLSSFKAKGIDYCVYANKTPEQPLETLINDNKKIIRCWTRGIFSTIQLSYQILKDRPNLIHIQYELFMLGKGVTALLSPFLFLAIRILRIPILVTIHGIPPLSKLEKTFIQGYGLKIPPIILRITLWIIVWIISSLSNQIILHRKDFIEVLTKEYHTSKQKIMIIPLGIEIPNKILDSEESKIKLGFQRKRVILFFGYLSKYKGLELLIESFRLLIKKHKDLLLIIAGDDTPGLAVRSRHPYSTILKSKAKKISPKIQFTGFINEEDIGLYFSASDLLVLPYSVGLSSSGPLSLAISYNTPFLISSELSSVINLEVASFEPNVLSITKKIDQYLQNKNLRHEILRHASILKKERSWSRISAQTEQIYLNYDFGCREKIRQS